MESFVLIVQIPWNALQCFVEQCRRLAISLDSDLAYCYQSVNNYGGGYTAPLSPGWEKRSDAATVKTTRIILITTLELQPGIIHVQINLGRDLTWHLTSSRDQQFYLLYLSWLIFSFLPALSTHHFILVQKL
ncbi:hypothetical protein NC651_039709 [Populus alba x Populus x berolinensis]|nr:hypothetical protein NC651_039709 [Populus alba x Populus x berolinensis]